MLLGNGYYLYNKTIIVFIVPKWVDSRHLNTFLNLKCFDKKVCYSVGFNEAESDPHKQLQTLGICEVNESLLVCPLVVICLSCSITWHSNGMLFFLLSFKFIVTVDGSLQVNSSLTLVFKFPIYSVKCIYVLFWTALFCAVIGFLMYHQSLLMMSGCIIPHQDQVH